MHARRPGPGDVGVWVCARARWHTAPDCAPASEQSQEAGLAWVQQLTAAEPARNTPTCRLPHTTGMGQVHAPARRPATPCRHNTSTQCALLGGLWDLICPPDWAAQRPCVSSIETVGERAYLGAGHPCLVGLSLLVMSHSYRPANRTLPGARGVAKSCKVHERCWRCPPRGVNPGRLHRGAWGCTRPHYVAAAALPKPK